MRRGKYQKKKVDYVEGYDHYDKKKTIAVTFFMSEAEKSAMDDMMAAAGIRNQSEFIRKQIFKAYKDLTPEQLEQMAEVAKWRADDDRA